MKQNKRKVFKVMQTFELDMGDTVVRVYSGKDDGEVGLADTAFFTANTIFELFGFSVTRLAVKRYCPNATVIQNPKEKVVLQHQQENHRLKMGAVTVLTYTDLYALLKEKRLAERPVRKQLKKLHAEFDKVLEYDKMTNIVWATNNYIRQEQEVFKKKIKKAKK